MTAKKPTAAENAKKIGAQIDAILKTEEDHGRAIHECAVSCMAHARDFGDATLADRLVKGLKSTNRKNLVLWFTTFSPIRWNGDGKVGLLKKEAKTYTPFNVEDAYNKPFWTMDEGQDDQDKKGRPLTLDKLVETIRRMQKRLEKAVAEGRFEGDVDVAKAYLATVAVISPFQRPSEQGPNVEADAPQAPIGEAPREGKSFAEGVAGRA